MPKQFNNKIQRANGGPGSAGVMAVDFNSSYQWQDMPGPRTGEQLRQLQAMLGQVHTKRVLR